MFSGIQYFWCNVWGQFGSGSPVDNFIFPFWILTLGDRSSVFLKNTFFFSLVNFFLFFPILSGRFIHLYYLTLPWSFSSLLSYLEFLRALFLKNSILLSEYIFYLANHSNQDLGTIFFVHSLQYLLSSFNVPRTVLGVRCWRYSTE